MQNYLLFSVPVVLTIYWVSVFVKALKLKKVNNTSVNAIPMERIGKRIRILWVPTILFMLINAWITAFAPQLKRNLWLYPLDNNFYFYSSYIALGAMLLALILTFICWHTMGKTWRIGINPNEKNKLIQNGPYKYVAHPIYTLAFIIKGAAVLIMPTLWMLCCATLHIVFVFYESRREESYLEGIHQQHYRDYRANIGRFFPKLRVLLKTVL